jgi:hypothetical protein
MRFEFYNERLRDVPKISVDGTVDNAIHFSHWNGNRTDSSVKADTSTEIALNVVASPERERLTQGVELVTNNHFDADGVLSVWTMLAGEKALELREKLISVAEAGDFSEFPSEEAVKSSIVIQGSDYAIVDGVASPLARERNGGRPIDEERAYQLVLPEVAKVVADVNGFEHLWRDEWERISETLDSFASGRSSVAEHPVSGLSVITLDPGLAGVGRFKPAEYVNPYTAIAHNARGSLFLIALPLGNKWAYRIDYPYYSWAQTVKRPPIERHELSNLAVRLNEIEAARSGKQPAGYWRVDRSELSSAMKFVSMEGALAESVLEPPDVARIVETEVSTIISEGLSARG